LSSPRAWSFLAISGPKQYGGNTGYEDDPAAVYRYDERVANHLAVKNGDVVVVRSRDAVLGISTIERIVEGSGDKIRRRCPQCLSIDIKARTSREPRWRCRAGHEFDLPLEDKVSVRTFEACYGSGFRACSEGLTLERLGAAVMRPSDQMSIREIDLGRLERWLLDDPSILYTLLDFAARLEADACPPVLCEASSSIIDERRRVLREIALRRGQAKFRNQLIKRYGAKCQISQCSFPGLVEAAHIRPYATTGNNCESNGVLLRSDLHTLFDLGMLAVSPDTLRVALHPSALSAGYGLYENVPLDTNGSPGPDRSALVERWELFRSTLAECKAPQIR
jgi:putative restriction endonuclease